MFVVKCIDSFSYPSLTEGNLYDAQRKRDYDEDLIFLVYDDQEIWRAYPEENFQRVD